MFRLHPCRTASDLPAAALLAAFCGLRTVCAEDVIKDDTYNMPAAVTATMGVDEAMVKMETAVKPEVLEAFKKANPAPFWLFGEDRQLAVRNNILPAHWFADGAKQHGHFSGVVRPGEFYVFQLCVVGGEKRLYSASIDSKISLAGATFTRVSHAPIWHEDFPFEPGTVKPIWIGLQIPKNAKPGTYAGTVEISAAEDPVHAPSSRFRFKEDFIKAARALSIKVEGAPLPEDGTQDAWRLARLKWLDSTIGESDAVVTAPFTPIKVDKKARTLDILGRRITLGGNGIPAQFTSYFSGSNTRILKTGRDAFAVPPALEAVVDGKAVAFKPAGFKFTKMTPVGVEWQAESTAGELGLTVTGRLEFDGNLQLRMYLHGDRQEIKLDDVRFSVPWKKDAVKYAMGLGMQGGPCPAKRDWKWDVSKNQDSVWLGDANIGAMLRFKGDNYRRPLINAYYAFAPLALPESWGGGGISIETRADAVALTAFSGAKTVRARTKGEDGLHFNLDWYFTPFKPLDVKQHFTDRYYHAGQGAKVEDTAALRKEGATILEVHHNRLCNPYINYPYNDDSIGNLTGFIKQAHADGMRVAVYYTTRELTQNLPEFFALKSMDGEVILKRAEGVKWPCTNANGPHPWLQQHVGLDIVPAWRENLKFPDYKSKLDLAVITTPDSRWNNFYLEGLDYLVKKAKIDGLYIDDTALDRNSMQRARRILDADGDTGRRVNMHSWNHFNGLAAWNNSAIAFMELYPYYNGLWHGEGFNANAAPEFMLVEMSGIPYGLMSEMLDHPNPWHGMVFGMRTRWPWSGDPRRQWAFEAAFGIADSEFIGWFDPACPVKTGNAKVKASVFRKPGKTLIAVGNWDKDATVKLEADWKALGLNPAKARLKAPAIEGFQPAAEFAPGAEITVPAGKGWMLIAE